MLQAHCHGPDIQIFIYYFLGGCLGFNAEFYQTPKIFTYIYTKSVFLLMISNSTPSGTVVYNHIHLPDTQEAWVPRKIGLTEQTCIALLTSL